MNERKKKSAGGLDNFGHLLLVKENKSSIAKSPSDPLKYINVTLT